MLNSDTLTETIQAFIDVRRNPNEQLIGALASTLGYEVLAPHENVTEVHVRSWQILFSNSGSGCQALQRSSLPGPLFSPR